MDRLVQLLRSFAAKIRSVWMILWDDTRPVFVYSLTARLSPKVLRKPLFVVPVLRVLSGKGASSAILLTQRKSQRSLRAPRPRATGHWNLVRHGPDSLTPLNFWQTTVH